MKKIFILIAVLTVISCANKQKTENREYIVLSGKIENQKAAKISIINNDFTKEISLNAEGIFTDTLRVDTGYYSLYHDRTNATLFLTKGEELKITTDATKFIDSMRFEGKDATSNKFLVDKVLRNRGKDPVAIFSQEEGEFIKTMSDIRDVTSQKLKEATDLDEAFIAFEKKNIKYAHLINLSRYPQYYPYYSKNENYKPSETFMAYFKNIEYDNEEDFKIYENFRQLARQHYSKKLNPFEDVKGSVATIKNLKSQVLKNTLAQELAFFISPSGKDADYLYTALSEISTNEKFKKELTKKYTDIQKLKAGKDSPTFDYENHKGGTTSLADLQGKYVYIDVWATWCGPCIAEIPSLKKVEKDYHNKNINFVSISIDALKDHDKWKKMVTDKELGGVQLMADKAWQSQFVTDYVIDGIPRFILIDPNGKIVNADAPRPSDKKLIELFDELKI
ncbi:thiol-disulfide oxidoreductase ResA [Kordia sp. SMS9]|uniref:TlpA family protein disulfide reductase n=1 Tax=Kordia sp. SMS9 TaxID=2282170 RepID=UPI000E0CE51F|nr:TlpA disulfide reductase family protein [Kordia sp. SMS9]AXG71994.1 thiol-disulfide oxidoreductase ResA [Kordia sp. SMS9]